MRARDQSDNDQRHKRNEESIIKHLEMLQDHSTHFDSLGTVTTMLVENMNMQLESELADLLDRNLMALYGIADQTNKGTDNRTQHAKEQAQKKSKQISTLKNSDSILGSETEPDDILSLDVSKQAKLPKIDNRSAISIIDSKV